MHVNILMPCLDETSTVIELVTEIHEALKTEDISSSFLLVDDGSVPPLAESLPNISSLAEIEVHVLQLNRNLGHQRAIACGLCHLGSGNMPSDVVVIMDSDGEDKPADVVRLVKELSGSGMQRGVVFAERARRTEGTIFRIGYWFYLSLHSIIIGQAPRVGNFSCLNRTVIPGLITDSDLWSHYAATVCKSRIPNIRLPVARGTRRRGRSRLNLGGLVLHGLAAISCYRETFVLRALSSSCVLLFVSGILLGLSFFKPWFSGVGILSPANLAAAFVFCIAFQYCMIALWQCFNVMQNRHQATFIPVRDYVYFVPQQTTRIIHHTVKQEMVSHV